MAFFQQTYAGLTRLAAEALHVFKVSLIVSVLLDLLVVGLLAATALGNGTTYIAFAVAALFFMAWCVLVALATLKESLDTLNATIQMASGLSPAQALQSAANVTMAGAGLGAAALTGGASLALLGMAAQHHTGSRRYAAGAVLGHTPLGAVGEIGAALGYLSDEELLPGLHVGRHSRHSDWGAIRRRMAGDARVLKAASAPGAGTTPPGAHATAPTPTPASPRAQPSQLRRAGQAARPSHAQPIRSNGARRARWSMPPRPAAPLPSGPSTPAPRGAPRRAGVRRRPARRRSP